MIGNGGNGLILHNGFLNQPLDSGEPLGLLWKKLWKRGEKVTKKKRKIAKIFEEKESYKWVKSIRKISEVLEKEGVNNSTKVIHVFDREGDISEVFSEAQK